MPPRMRRGKQQILLNHLPGKTFDFDRIGVIARVDRVRGTPRTDLNGELILNAVKEYASAWNEGQRPTLRNDVLSQPSRFVLLDPTEVKAIMFPSVFWCQQPICGRILSVPDGEAPSATCPTCRSGRLVQLRFVRVHRCGALEPLRPYFCRRCNTSNSMALDTRGSERIGNFRWRCLRCRTTYSVFAGRCRECDWTNPVPGVDHPANANIEVHRARRTFHSHHVVLLNQPSRELNAFLATPEWEQLAGAAFLDLPELGGRKLSELRLEGSSTPVSPQFDEAALRAQGFGDEQVRQFLDMQAQLTASRSAAEPSEPSKIAQALIQSTGVSAQVWQSSGQEMLEAVLPLQSSTIRQLSASDGDPAEGVRSIRAESVTLVEDFPVTTATFGFSRVDYQPNRCRLNPFPPDRDHGGKYPVFVDLVQADALLIRLDPTLVLRWLERNGHSPRLPQGTGGQQLLERSYFVDLLDGVPMRENLRADRATARMVFALLHTFSHLAVRQAALLCGLDATSLSEYILPRALTFALYCNHRFGATIGALTSLYEQSLNEWLRSITESDRCVYDPVCADAGASCHSCSHLTETSCRFFNLNLSRSFLFGGRDQELGDIASGYFDTP